jgi:diglucosylglycerate octanoyltransferase
VARRLVVLGDSLAFHGPEGPVPLTEARLYPNQLGVRLAVGTGESWDVAVVARAGWCTRDLWLALQKDVHLQQQVLMGADAVVIGIGGADALTVGLPRSVMAVLPFVRPTPLRRWLRQQVDRAHPALIGLTAELLRFTPRSVYRHCWRKSVEAVRLFTRDAPLCALMPPLHAGPYYRHSLRHHHDTVADTGTLAADLNVPLVDVPALMGPWLDRLNPDGLHWPWELHAAVAEAMAEVLLVQVPRRATAG